jgi:hypothetical protein
VRSYYLRWRFDTLLFAIESPNELGTYHEHDELDTCVEKACELLQDSALTRIPSHKDRYAAWTSDGA